MPITIDFRPGSANPPKPEVHMTRVRMRETRKAALDGHPPTTFESGTSYEVPEELATAWFSSGRAEEDKMVEGAPEVKDGAAPEAKAKPAHKAKKK